MIFQQKCQYHLSLPSDFKQIMHWEHWIFFGLFAAAIVLAISAQVENSVEKIAVIAM